MFNTPMLYIASDHAGFELKQRLVDFFKNKLKLEVDDLGPYQYDDRDDYPDFIIPLAKQVAREPGSRGIVIGGSGQGEAVAANRIKGVRAAVYYGGPLELVALSRRHNNANVLSLGARFISLRKAKKAVRAWLTTAFEGGKHERRIEKLDQEAISLARDRHTVAS